MQLMKEITLTKGLTAKVDDEDYAAVMAAGPWHAVKPHPTSGGYYAQRRMRAAENNRRRLQYLHTFLSGFRRTDHRNGDTLDNRRINLREATHAQNAANARPQQGGSSPHKGVTWDAAHGRWRAQITVSGKRQYLGLHDDERAAARAYDVAAREHFGEHARLNLEE